MALKDCKVGPAAAVSDIARAREFYEGKLGLEPKPMGDEMVLYECGGETGLMVYASEHAGTNKATLAGFDVADFDAEWRDLRERGVEFERYEEMGADEDGIIAGDGFRVAFFKDPDGNNFSING